MRGGNAFGGVRPGAGTERRAFTLIELLVVISIVVLLMALLLPALSLARKQAQAVACQARLRQAGMGIAVAIENNDGRFLNSQRWGAEQVGSMAASGLFYVYPPFTESPELALCPSATKSIPGVSEYTLGDTFSAYHLTIFDESITGSYGQNQFVRDTPRPTKNRFNDPITARGTSRVPYLLDSVGNITHMLSGQRPPDYEGQIAGQPLSAVDADPAAAVARSMVIITSMLEDTRPCLRA